MRVSKRTITTVLASLALLLSTSACGGADKPVDTAAQPTVDDRQGLAIEQWCETLTPVLKADDTNDAGTALLGLATTAPAEVKADVELWGAFNEASGSAAYSAEADLGMQAARGRVVDSCVTAQDDATKWTKVEACEAFFPIGSAGSDAGERGAAVTNAWGRVPEGDLREDWATYGKLLAEHQVLLTTENRLDEALEIKLNSAASRVSLACGGNASVNGLSPMPLDTVCPTLINAAEGTKEETWKMLNQMEYLDLGELQADYDLWKANRNNGSLEPDAATVKAGDEAKQRIVSTCAGL